MLLGKGMNSQQPEIRLPELAGLCSLARSQAANWSVEQSVTALKVLHYSLKRLAGILSSKVTAEPYYELKMLYCHHAYIFAEQVQSVRKRVSEMREPPLGLEDVPNENLEFCFDEIECSGRTEFLLAGVYGTVFPFVLELCQSIKKQAHPLADAPTVRLAKLCEFELEEILEVGEAAKQALVDQIEEAEGQSANQKRLDEWLNQISSHFNYVALDTFSATDDPEKSVSPQRIPFFSESGRAYENLPRRDARFKDPYNAGVNPEAFLYDDRFSARDKTLMMYYKRLREIDVPEMMASILYELRDEESWEFHYEMTRQLWDEARHAMMGEVGFRSLGIDWTDIPINWTWSLNLNSQLSARERHGVLFFIEQGLMPKTGKRYEWEIAKQSTDRLAALFQDFDWADEVLHAQIGRRWYVSQFDSLSDAMEYGDKCWSQVMSHWQDYKDQGLTEHRNWWPELYEQACKRWEVIPDKNALEFDVSYADIRADLKEI